MATADFNLSLTLRGTPDEMRSMLQVLERYCGNEVPAYFVSPEIEAAGESVFLEHAEPEELDELLEQADGELSVTAGGPYGQYFDLNEIDIFRDMAKAVPDGSFEAAIDGCTSYTEQSLECELKDGRLHISTFFLSNEEGPEAYIEYFMEQLPCEEFVKLFKIQGEEFDEDSYLEFVDSFLVEDEGLTEMEFEDFIGEIGEDNCDLDEESYAEALKQYAQRGIMAYEEYMEECDIGDRNEYEYDPVEGVYITSDGVKPVEKVNETLELNETFREYLKENGLPHDDAAIAALSLEDAYEILAGTYGKHRAEETEAAEGEPSEYSPEQTEAQATDTAELSPESAAAEPTESQAAKTKKKKRSKVWIVWLVVAAAVAVLAAVAVYCPYVAELFDRTVSILTGLIG